MSKGKNRFIENKLIMSAMDGVHGKRNAKIKKWMQRKANLLVLSPLNFDVILFIPSNEGSDFPPLEQSSCKSLMARFCLNSFDARILSRTHPPATRNVDFIPHSLVTVRSKSKSSCSSSVKSIWIGLFLRSDDDWSLDLIP